MIKGDSQGVNLVTINNKEFLVFPYHLAKVEVAVAIIKVIYVRK